MGKISSICVTCLSTERDLISLHKIKQFLDDIKFPGLMTYNSAICWECRSVIMKFYKFKNKALEAQAILYGNIKKTNRKSLSYLQIKINKDFNYEFCHVDPLNGCDTEIKTENEIKEEVNERLDLVNNNDYNLTDTTDIQIDSNKIESIYVDSIDIEASDIKKSDVDKKEIEGKYVQVVFTEEQMIKNREDKRNHHNFKKIPYKCDSCVLGFTRKETYEDHVFSKHDESKGSVLCDVCQIRFTTEAAMTTHRWRHYMCYKCKLCKYTTTELWAIENHCKNKHEKDRVNSIHCSQCVAVFKTPEELEVHIQTIHTIHCDECGVKFKGKDNLRSHKTRIHAFKREFICDICKKTFINKTRLESHIASHNSDLTRKLSYCHVCKVQYKNISIYRSHIKNSAIHTEKTYSCPECNKIFVSKVYWSQHYKFYHLRQSQYKCDLCNKLFISDWRLKNHKQIHHGLSRSRDHHCNICGKKFFTVSNLRNHTLTHSDQRSYMCEDCGDTFKQRPALYTHSKLVHGGKKKKEK